MIEWLTKRECEILMLKCQGVTNKDIARQLNVTVEAVEDHISNILSKLKGSDKREPNVTTLGRRLPDQQDT